MTNGTVGAEMERQGLYEVHRVRPVRSKRRRFALVLFIAVATVMAGVGQWVMGG